MGLLCYVHVLLNTQVNTYIKRPSSSKYLTPIAPRETGVLLLFHPHHRVIKHLWGVSARIQRDSSHRNNGPTSTESGAERSGEALRGQPEESGIPFVPVQVCSLFRIYTSKLSHRLRE